MKNSTNILLSITLIFSIVIFSSFNNNSVKEEVKKEIKTENNNDEKENVVIVEYQATVSAGAMFSPILLIDVIVDTFIMVLDDDRIDLNLALKSQEFYRIFFTHIISKNAP